MDTKSPHKIPHKKPGKVREHRALQFLYSFRVYLCVIHRARNHRHPLVREAEKTKRQTEASFERLQFLFQRRAGENSQGCIS